MPQDGEQNTAEDGEFHEDEGEVVLDEDQAPAPATAIAGAGGDGSRRLEQGDAADIEQLQPDRQTADEDCRQHSGDGHFQCGHPGPGAVSQRQNQERRQSGQCKGRQQRQRGQHQA
jgi:hypothetical protein